MAEPYSREVIDHYRNPRNLGRLPDSDLDVAMGEAGRAAEGDLVRIQIRVGPDDQLREIAFKAFGCPATIASASLATERVLGRSLDAAEQLSARELADGLCLSSDQTPSANLARAALLAAIGAFRRKAARPLA